MNTGLEEPEMYITFVNNGTASPWLYLKKEK